MSADQLRRSIRAELHAARCRDKDHSETRLWHDARKLDERMTEAKYPPSHPTAWGTVPPGFQRPQNPRQAAFRFGKSTIASSDDSECQPDDAEAAA